MRNVMSLILLLILSVVSPSLAVVIKPVNFNMPNASGDIFSFELAVLQNQGEIQAKGCNTTVQVSGYNGFTFNQNAKNASLSIVSEDKYWLKGNSAGAGSREVLPSSFEFEFGDGPSTGNGILGGNIEFIVAKYAFIWDGTEGQCKFSFDFSDLNKNYIFRYNENSGGGFSTQDYEDISLSLPSENWYSSPIVAADASSFTVQVPEPTTMLLLGLGGIAAIHRRRAIKSA